MIQRDTGQFDHRTEAVKSLAVGLATLVVVSLPMRTPVGITGGKVVESTRSVRVSKATPTGGVPTRRSVPPVARRPAITSAWRDITTPGHPMAPVTVTATGYPIPTLRCSALPPGIRFTDTRNGTGTLAGTPEPSATGQYRVVITASNESGIARQTFDLAIMRVKSRRSLVLLAGQSNAAGWESYATDPTSGVDYLAAPYSNEADLSSTISWMPSNGYPAANGGGPTGQVPLDTPQELFNSSGGSAAIFGPEIGWARQTYANTGQALSVVKAAFAGASLAEDWNPTIRSGDYANMIAKISSTMSADAGAGQLDTIAGIAWYQGERDAQHLGMAAHYRSNLIALIAALRPELPMDPTVAIVLVKESLRARIALIDRSGACATTAICTALTAGDTKVRAADDWAAAHLSHVIEVDTFGLPRTPDIGLHLTNTSELAIGCTIANAIARASISSPPQPEACQNTQPAVARRSSASATSPLVGQATARSSPVQARVSGASGARCRYSSRPPDCRLHSRKTSTLAPSSRSRSSLTESRRTRDRRSI